VIDVDLRLPALVNFVMCNGLEMIYLVLTLKMMLIIVNLMIDLIARLEIK